MRQVRTTGVAKGRSAAELYPVICDFPRYPELTDAVLRVDTEDFGDGRAGCSWEVKFRRGILKWTEEERFDAARHRVEFTLRDGDLDHLTGHWQLRDEEGGCRVEFACEFDMGIPTLADVIEPIAAQTLGDYIAVILRALVGEIEIQAGTESGTEPGAGPGADRPTAADDGGRR
ncbi:type II toxin-antitoxin system RatA family toxin [Streptomyces orinoci]|uniref:SRPBCC family protein n=1 Tax=Streptomyces orinoci TaxID=67339 RepID=A0ABV3JQV0_STRON|nr:SRPBCC family protein [Streptomyces orinoci]